MALPCTIPLRYTEEDAGYLSVRPVVKQTFQLHELVDLIVRVTGKDPARAQQILRSGTVVYHGYRYWWEPLTANLPELAGLLLPFPNDNPSRPFVPGEASEVLLEMGGGTQRIVTEVTRSEATRKKLFARQSPLDSLMEFAGSRCARYESYNHGRKADLFRMSLPFDEAQRFLANFLAAAPRDLRHRWSTLKPPAALTFVCPRR